LAFLTKKYLALEKNILDSEHKSGEMQEMAQIDAMRRDINSNYQLWLVTCLIIVNDFEDAELVIGSIWGDEKLDLTLHKELCMCLFDYLEIATSKMSD
jgi:hypothetical protein